MIKQFQNEYRWLSNFAPVEVELEGVTYPSVEHAYMSAKSDSKEWKEFCANTANTAGTVKKASRNITLVENWDSIKLDVMKALLQQKFSKNPYKNLLRQTGDVHIQEGNSWNDKFWGVCLKTNTGENHLGKIIMDIRSSL